MTTKFQDKNGKELNIGDRVVGSRLGDTVYATVVYIDEIKEYGFRYDFREEPVSFSNSTWFNKGNKTTFNCAKL
jgi:hypothetical protein